MSGVTEFTIRWPSHGAMVKDKACRSAQQLGALNDKLLKRPATRWKSLTLIQQSKAQLNVVVENGEEIGATIRYSQRTPFDIRLQTEKWPLWGPPTASILATVRKNKPKPTRIKLPTENVIIWTWNVRTLNQCWKLKELSYALAKYRWDILRLSETL